MEAKGAGRSALPFPHRHFRFPARSLQAGPASPERHLPDPIQAQQERPGGAFACPARPARRVSERGFRYRAGMRPTGGGAGRGGGAPGPDRLAAQTGVGPRPRGACPECPRCGSRRRRGCPASLALAAAMACEMPLPRDAVLPAPAQRAPVCRASGARGKFGSACSIRPCRAFRVRSSSCARKAHGLALSAGCSCCSDGIPSPWRGHRRWVMTCPWR